MKIDPELSNDLITELPTNVIERILVCLPLQEAVRTSILSRQWRYKWATIPQLKINDQCIVTLSRDETVLNSKLLNFIDGLLLLHRGPIQKFKLSISNLLGCSAIDRWILFLSRNGIKEFILSLSPWDVSLKVPSCLFSCKQLIRLKLHHCILNCPPTFDGFNNLRSLDLRFPTFVGCTLQSIISGCPLLERLTVLYLEELNDLKIHAPNLKYLNLTGGFKSICFRNTQLLSTVSIGLLSYDEKAQNVEQQRTSNLIHILGCLVGLEELDIRTFFLKFLAMGHVPNRLPNTFNHLRKLELFEVSFCELNEFSAILCLIKSAPNLQLLEIWVKYPYTIVQPGHILVVTDYPHAKVETILKYLEAHDFSECSLNQLQVVKIAGILGERHELEFIKILLANTPALERMTVQMMEDKFVKRGLRMLKELVRFWRASPKAEIEYLTKEDLMT